MSQIESHYPFSSFAFGFHLLLLIFSYFFSAIFSQFWALQNQWGSAWNNWWCGNLTRQNLNHVPSLITLTIEQFSTVPGIEPGSAPLSCLWCIYCFEIRYFFALEAFPKCPSSYFKNRQNCMDCFVFKSVKSLSL